MTYNVQWASSGTQGIPGKSTIVIPDLTTNTSTTSLTLTGRDIAAYGEIQQTNFIRLLESFASRVPPANATIGQLWYDANFGILRVKIDPSIVTTGTYSAGGSSWAVASANGLTPSVLASGLGYIPLNKTGDNITGNLAFDGTHTITGLPVPVAADQAAPKGYVDSTASGLHIHDSVRVTTTSSLTTTYLAGISDTNGGAGIGATLTNNGALAAIIIDTVTLLVNDRVLIKNQTDARQNGIYIVTHIGSNSTQWILTRASDYDDSAVNSPPQVSPGNYIFINQGTQAGSSWVQRGNGTGASGSILIGTDNIIFTQFSAATVYNSGPGISIVGNLLSNTGVTSLTGSSNISVSSATGTITLSLTGSVPSAVSAATAGIATTVSVGTSSSSSPLKVAFLSAGSVLSDNTLTYTPSTGTLATTVFLGSLNGNAQTASQATTTINIVGGGTGYIPYQTGANTTSFIATGANGQVLTLSGGVPTWQNPASGSGFVTSIQAGAGINVSGPTGIVTISNAGVTSVAGTANQVIAANSGGAVTLSLPQSIHASATPTFASITLGASLITPNTSIVGSLAIGGAKGNYAGIQFTGTNGNRSLLISTASNAVSGVYNTNASSWDWQWTGSTLTLGTIPAANIGAGTAAINISGNATSATSAATSTTQATGNNGTSIATTAFVQNQIAATGSISPSFWTYSNPAALSSTGIINWQAATTSPVGINAYSGGQVTVQIAGFYFITATAVVGVNSDTIGQGQISIEHNGTVVGTNITASWQNQSVYNSAQQSSVLTVTAIIFCSSLDIVRVIYSNTGHGTLVSGQGSFVGFKMA